MQTFLPVPNFEETAKILDYRRLGKQRVEAKQILNTILNGGGWKNHPAVKMWRGFESALGLYMDCMIREWIKRGYKNTMPLLLPQEPLIMPPWIGLEIFHASHRSNLLRKNSKYYSQFGWIESQDLPYYWPENRRGE